MRVPLPRVRPAKPTSARPAPVGTSPTCNQQWRLSVLRSSQLWMFRASAAQHQQSRSPLHDTWGSLVPWFWRLLLSRCGGGCTRRAPLRRAAQMAEEAARLRRSPCSSCSRRHRRMDAPTRRVGVLGCKPPKLTQRASERSQAHVGDARDAVAESLAPLPSASALLRALPGSRARHCDRRDCERPRAWRL